MARFSRNDYSRGTSAVGDFFAVLLLGAIALVGFAGVIAVMTLIRGLVLVQLWKWFLLPYGAPHIGVAAALGLAVTVGALVPSNSTSFKNDNGSIELKSSTHWTGVFAPLITLFIGWIIHLFM